MLPASTKRSRRTPRRADWTGSLNRRSPISAPAALARCEALRQSAILGRLWKASGKGQEGSRQELRAAQKEPSTSLLAAKEGWTLLVSSRRQSLPGFSGRSGPRPIMVLDRFACRIRFHHL